MDTNSVETIGQRIRALRHERDMSIADLARTSGLTESTVYRLEAEGREPRAHTVQALAAALDVSADVILGVEHTFDVGEVLSGPLVDIPLHTRIDAEPEGAIAVPEVMLPRSVSHDRLAAVKASDDACAPEIRQDDVAIIDRDADWDDGQLVAVADPEGVLLIRYARAVDDQVLATGASPAVHMIVSPSAVWGPRPLHAQILRLSRPRRLAMPFILSILCILYAVRRCRCPLPLARRRLPSQGEGGPRSGGRGRRPPFTPFAVEGSRPPMPMTTCTDCGREISSDAQTCPHCGATTATSAKGTIVGCLGVVAIAIGTTIGALAGNVNTAIIAAFISFVLVIIAGVWWLRQP